jgi:hypothetical protein
MFRPTGEQIMAKANRRFGLFTFAIVTTATAAALAVAVLAYQPNLGTGSIALSIGTATPVPEAAIERHAADRMAVNQLAVFLQHWTNTAGGER